MHGFLRNYGDLDLQKTVDAAVVMPSLLRPVLAEALASIFAQNFSGTIQILIGIDKLEGDLSVLDAACATIPSHVAVQAYWPGYSTALRHGGLNAPSDGGCLRAVLTYLANSPYVAYLDDDNWWHPEHLAQMRSATEAAQWAFALRWFVHDQTRRPVCVDTWESVGPGQGMFQERFGGFVDPSCLMINKLACPLAAPHWTMPLPGDAGTSDRRVFDFLARNHKFKGTGKASVFYELNEKDGLHPMRVKIMGATYDEAGRL